MIGKVIKNNYKIMDEIGPGSVATVYLAKDMAPNQVVALKIIHPEQAAEGQFLQRFQREAKLLQMLSSPQAVKVFTCSPSCGAGAPVYEGAHLVMISPSCTGPDLSGPGYQAFNR